MRATRSSMCRIAPDFEGATLRALPRAAWEDGDYVVTEVVHGGGASARLELENGRPTEATPGDRVIGALGVRRATLEANADWRAVGDDGRMHWTTGGGLLGRITSQSPFMPGPIEVEYRGHVWLDGRKATMDRWLPEVPPRTWAIPTILVIGSSMSAGKTATGGILVRRLRAMGLRVMGAKLTGAGRWRDVLSLGDAGACCIYDFVDAGLPSTVCDEDTYRARIVPLLSRMAAEPVDVAVIEAGASPLEPYNGEAAIALLGDTIAMTVVCASDPYAAVGIEAAFGRAPDLIAGVATNTDAGIALVHRLTGRPAARLLDPESWPLLDGLLRRALDR